MRTLAVAKRIIKQIASDHRSIGLLLFAPIFVLFLLKTVLDSSSGDLLILNVNVPISSAISIADATIENATIDTAKDRLEKNEIDGYFYKENDKYNIMINGTDAGRSAKTLVIIKQVVSANEAQNIQNNIVKGLSSLPDMIKKQLPNMQISMPKTEFVENYRFGAGKDASMFSSLAPLIMGFLVFFFTFIFSGIAFIREKLTGTLERMMATPIRRKEIVLGYFLGFGIFMALQTIIMQLFATLVLKIPLQGGYFSIMLIFLLLAAQSLALGLALSAFARNEFQLFQFIPIIIVPQILFSGLFDLKDAPMWVKFLSNIFPLTYGVQAIKGIAIQGKTLFEVLPWLIISVGFLIIFIIFNAIVLKKYRAY